MSINAYIIELNDSEIRVAEDGRIILRSPGFAVVSKTGVQVGQEALQTAYLNPLETFNRYWYKLNQDALPTTTRYYRHHADLVHAHLLKLHEQAGRPEEIIFTVPGSYSEEQLAMLLGFAGACPFNAVGLIDTAVAAAATVAAKGKYQHIDIHLHQAIITQLDLGTSISRTGVETIDETGLIKIYSLLAGLVADLFIQQSRFDPLHHAETEQALYDQLPVCLNTLHHRKEVMFEIRYRSATHQAKLSRESLLQKLQPIYQKLAEHLSPSIPCLLSDRTAGLPGLTDFLPEPCPIKPESVFEMCRKYEGYIRSTGPELRFITALPRDETADPAEQAPPAKQKDNAGPVTHVLFDDRAYPLGHNITYLSKQGIVSDLEPADVLCSVASQNGTVILSPGPDVQVLVNGRAATCPTELQPGDRIHSPEMDAHYNFIHVVTGHGARTA